MKFKFLVILFFLSLSSMALGKIAPKPTNEILDSLDEDRAIELGKGNNKVRATPETVKPTFGVQLLSNLAEDSDGDGLPNSMDSCPNDNDDWFLVPRDWVGIDSNKVEDLSSSSSIVRTTKSGESAQDVTDAINENNTSDSSWDYVLFIESADDLGENLSLITLLYILNHGNQYRYHETTDIADLAKNYQRQAKNYGDSYTTGTTYSDLETVITDDGDGYSTKTINSKTDLVGVIQKKCLQVEVQKDIHP